MTKKVTGTVSIVGNEPLTHVVLTLAGSGAPRQVLVLGPIEKTLRQDYQGRTVTLEGSDCRPARPGFTDCINPTRIIPD
ncbi:MAG TPA: hypothetical protein VIU29_02750 [Candidatus Deferrimicrobiaceae bacterium]